MKYPYSVKYNGKWYPPNTELPETAAVAEDAAAAEPETEPDPNKGAAETPAPESKRKARK